MTQIHLPEAVGSALPALSPGTESDAGERETRVEFGWLAEESADLGRLIRSRKSLTMASPFFFDFIGAVDECWSAMEMRQE